MAWTSKSPAPQKNLKNPSRISLVTPFHHPPAAMTLSWRLELATLLHWSRLARHAHPECVRIFLFVLVYVELVSCPTTFRSCVSKALHPEFSTHWFLVVGEPDLTRPLSAFSFISPSFGPSTPSRQPGVGWSPLDR
jgi:hypothetical protein